MRLSCKTKEQVASVHNLTYTSECAFTGCATLTMIISFKWINWIFSACFALIIYQVTLEIILVKWTFYQRKIGSWVINNSNMNLPMSIVMGYECWIKELRPPPWNSESLYRLVITYIIIIRFPLKDEIVVRNNEIVIWVTGCCHCIHHFIFSCTLDQVNCIEGLLLRNLESICFPDAFVLLITCALNLCPTISSFKGKEKGSKVTDWSSNPEIHICEGDGL